MKIKDKLIMVLVSIIALGCVVLGSLEIPLWKLFKKGEYSWSLKTEDLNKKIAEIVEVQGRVKVNRKKHNFYSYDQIGKNSFLYDKDFIIVEGEGSISVLFNNGDKYEIHGGSSGVVSYQEAETMDVDVFRNSKIEMIAGKIEQIDVKVPEVRIVEKIKFIPAEPKVVEKIVYVDKIIEASPEVVDEKRNDLNLETPLVSGEPSLINNRILSNKDFFVQLKWSGDNRANKFRVLYSRNGSEFVLLKETSDTFFVGLKNDFNSKYSFKVLAYKNDKLINESKEKSLNFRFLSPLLNKPEESFVFKGKTFLTWSKTSFSKSYVLLISKDNLFEKSKEIVVNNNFWEGNLPSGDYYWKVKSVLGNKTTGFSDSRKFTVDK